MPPSNMAESLSEESEDTDGSVDLGFAEKCESKIYLSSLFFPSKIGGRPSWLRWDSLPNSDALQCGHCQKQLILLCQIYVPLELPSNSDTAELYHRTLYLFCCRNGPCSKYDSFIKAFRTERLQKTDELNYNESEKDEDELNDLCKQMEKQYSLCNLCGCHGDKMCSSCHNVKYCCKDHQTIDWKHCHKRECQNSSVSCEINSTDEKHPLLFNEYEIVIETEPLEDVNKDPTAHPVEISDETRPTDRQLEKDLMKLDEQKIDEYFTDFKERIDREPEQIIRYDLGKQPLWVSSENIPTDEQIPCCSCGAKRQFEFQVLPQMINYLGVETTIDSIDWGTLCVYTCADNCINGNSYKEEFIWKQDFS